MQHLQKTRGTEHLQISIAQPTSHLPYTLPSSVSRNPFICHSYENCRGVYQQFPFWNSSLITYHSPRPHASKPANCSCHVSTFNCRLSTSSAPFFHGSRDTDHDPRFPVRSILWVA